MCVLFEGCLVDVLGVKENVAVALAISSYLLSMQIPFVIASALFSYLAILVPILLSSLTYPALDTYCIAITYFLDAIYPFLSAA